MNIKNYGIDLGYGYVKAVSNTERIMFPTLCNPFENTIDQELNNMKYVAKIDNRQYAVGYYAAMQDGVRELKKEHQLDEEKVPVFIGTALSLLSDTEPIDEDINLSLGLPVDFYKPQHEPLKNMLTGLTIKTEVNGKEKNFNIKNVIVTQQAVSAFLALYHNADGTRKDDELIDKQFGAFGGGIIDIGYNTLDLVRIDRQDGSFSIISKKSCSYEGMGAVYAHQKATDKINSALGFKLDAAVYERYLNADGIMPALGGIVDVRPYFQKAYSILADEIKKTISNLWGDIASFGGLYMTGGTAEKIIPHLTNIKNIDIKLQEDPMFANALGLLVKLNRAFPVSKKEMAGVSGGKG